MATTVEELKAAARAAFEAELDAKFAALTPLTDAAKRVESLEAKLADARAEYGTAWAAAVKTGWTESELTREAKFEKPVSVPRARKKTATRPASSPAAQPLAPAV